MRVEGVEGAGCLWRGGRVLVAGSGEGCCGHALKARSSRLLHLDTSPVRKILRSISLTAAQHKLDSRRTYKACNASPLLLPSLSPSLPL